MDSDPAKRPKKPANQPPLPPAVPLGDLRLTLRDLGEREFIRSVVESEDEPNASSESGVVIDFGDDAAVFRAAPGAPMQVVTVDAMVQDTHFRAATPAESVGFKLAAVNLSDIAAMGAKPTVAVVSIAAPGDTTAKWLKDLYRGLRRCANEFGFRLVGGDTVRGEKIALSLTMLGIIPDGVEPPRRANARPGDYVYVTGRPGESGAGLQLAEIPGLRDRLRPGAAARLIARHYYPTPRMKAGQALARSLERLALVDVSDGVLNEVDLICQASGGLGAALELERFPLSPDLKAFAKIGETKPRNLFLRGGEDYELLFACAEPPREIAAILKADQAGIEARMIGRIRHEPGVVVLDASGTPVEIEDEGFQHF